MAVTAKKNDIYEYAPTRVYSYSRSSTAEAAEPLAKQPENKTESKQKKAQKKKTAAAARAQVKRAVVSVCSIAAAAAVMIFVITRYAAINTSYSELNAMKANITAMEQEIEMLNVKLNTSVSLEEAREAALNAGMGYPTAEQVVSLDETGAGTR